MSSIRKSTMRVFQTEESIIAFRNYFCNHLWTMFWWLLVSVSFVGWHNNLTVRDQLRYLSKAQADVPAIEDKGENLKESYTYTYT
jgi:hypothetical protein